MSYNRWPGKVTHLSTDMRNAQAGCGCGGDWGEQAASIRGVRSSACLCTQLWLINNDAYGLIKSFLRLFLWYNRHTQ